jgi:hypothetical protein
MTRVPICHNRYSIFTVVAEDDRTDQLMPAGQTLKHRRMLLAFITLSFEALIAYGQILLRQG